MESFNFGAFDPTIGARIAAIPQEAQKQQTANMLQAMQMQGAMRQNEMSQMQLDEMKTDRAEMVKLQQDLAAKGGSPDLGQYADMLMRSPKHMKLGIELKQKLAQQAQFAEAMRDEPPARAAPAAAPMAPPEPGSFSADVAARTAAAPAFARPTNELAPTAAPTAPPVNALAAGGEALAGLQQKRNRLRGIDSDQARAALRSVDAEIALASKEPSYQYVPGVGLVNLRDKSVVVPSVESTDPVIKQYNLAVSQGFKGSILDYKREIARAGRAQAQPPAPSIQTIADPTDPTKAIVIDTRTYKPGGGLNSLGVFGNAPPAKTTETIREEELKTAYNTNRILNSAVQINNVLKKTPSASRPGGLEASAMAIFGNAGVANLSRSEDRQIVAAAQSDIIDSLLYLATGAAYNKEQLAQQRQSYLPAFTDEPGTVVAKQDALRGLIDGAKVRSGRAWTPKMQAAVDSLTGGATAPSPTPTAAATTPAVAPVKITGNADYDNLPSGAVFIDPKGQQRRKP